MAYKYFTDKEVEGLNPGLVEKLDRAREVAGVPFMITSGLRSPEDNYKAGGVSNSAHLRGLAVDLWCDGDRNRFRMLAALLVTGFNRIGLYQDGHLHVDIDVTLPQGVVWLK